MFLDAGPLVTWFPLQILCGAAMVGAIASLAASSTQQDRRPLRKALRDTAASLLPLILLTAIVSALVVLGSILVFPGLIVFAAWSVAGPAQVVERTGVLGALRRSADLTRRHRGVILGLVAIWLTVYFGLAMVTSRIPAALGFDGLARVDAPLVGAVAGLVYDLFVAALYLELRRAKDGIGLGEIDQIFA
jgi:hypothetical protein